MPFHEPDLFFLGGFHSSGNMDALQQLGFSCSSSGNGNCHRPDGKGGRNSVVKDFWQRIFPIQIECRLFDGFQQKIGK
jgi:hypothetical protein